MENGVLNWKGRLRQYLGKDCLVLGLYLTVNPQSINRVVNFVFVSCINILESFKKCYQKRKSAKPEHAHAELTKPLVPRTIRFAKSAATQNYLMLRVINADILIRLLHWI